MFNSKELDVLTMTEPLACVLHAHDKIPRYLQFENTVVYGGGPIGALHLTEIRKRFPNSVRFVIEPNSDRRKIMNGLFPDVIVLSSADPKIKAELSIIATSDPQASLDGIQYSSEAGVVLLFSGINHKTKEELPFFEGIHLEAVHRNEEIRVTSKGVRLIGSSGYHKSDIQLSSKTLLENPDHYDLIQTAIIESLISNEINGEKISVPAMEVMLNEPETYFKYLKVLFRIGLEQDNYIVTPESSYKKAKLKKINLTPHVEPGSLRLKMLRASICQTDRRVFLGTKVANFSENLILGHEGIATVESVGANVSYELVGKIVVVLPHHYVADPLVLRGIGFLSKKLEHLGIHRNGIFATRVDVPANCVLVLNRSELIPKVA